MESLVKILEQARELPSGGGRHWSLEWSFASFGAAAREIRNTARLG
jgi:hypothetical protein